MNYYYVEESKIFLPIKQTLHGDNNRSSSVTLLSTYLSQYLKYLVPVHSGSDDRQRDKEFHDLQHLLKFIVTF